MNTHNPHRIRALALNIYLTEIHLILLKLLDIAHKMKQSPRPALQTLLLSFSLLHGCCLAIGQVSSCTCPRACYSAVLSELLSVSAVFSVVLSVFSALLSADVLSVPSALLSESDVLSVVPSVLSSEVSTVMVYRS